MTSEASRALIAALSAEGAPARFVGGCVRDGVIGRTVKDVDIATPARPEDVIRLLDAAGIRTVPTGLAHGTVTAVIDHCGFEVTTLRRDVETDGRRAVVAFTDDWQADAARRDFTMNTLFCDADGTLYDPVGGLADLRAGRVRFVGTARARIAEDVLRLLRFFRFHGWYGRGEPDPEAIAACRAMAPKLPGLSAERIWGELSRTLLAPDPAAAYRLMEQAGVLARVLPEARRIERLAAAVAAEEALGLAPSAIRRLGAALGGTADSIPALGERLRMSRAETDRPGGGARDRCGAGTRPRPPRGPPRALSPRRGGVRRCAGARLGGRARRARSLARARRGACRLDPPAVSAERGGCAGRRCAARPGVGRLLGEVEEWWLDSGFAPDRAACLARLAQLIAG